MRRPSSQAMCTCSDTRSDCNPLHHTRGSKHVFGAPDHTARIYYSPKPISTQGVRNDTIVQFRNFDQHTRWRATYPAPRTPALVAPCSLAVGWTRPAGWSADPSAVVAWSISRWPAEPCLPVAAAEATAERRHRDPRSCVRGASLRNRPVTAGGRPCSSWQCFQRCWTTAAGVLPSLLPTGALLIRT